GAAVAGVAVAVLRAALAAELQRREAGVSTDDARGNLVDRDAVLDVGARRFLRMAAGEEGCRRARVVAGAVAEREAIVLREAGQDRNLILNGGQRLQDRRHLGEEALVRRAPRRHVDSVRNEAEGQSGR